jgi:hypothetical protein
MSNHMMIRTDFGVVNVVGSALNFIGGADGVAMANNKRRRSKPVKELRRRMGLLMTAANILAQIEYENGGDLQVIGSFHE